MQLVRRIIIVLSFSAGAMAQTTFSCPANQYVSSQQINTGQVCAVPTATSVSNTETAGAGGVAVNTFVSTDTSAPTRFITAPSGSCGAGVALATVTAGSTFTLSGAEGTVQVIADGGGVTAGHLIVGSTATPGRAMDAGTSTSLSVSELKTVCGTALNTVAAGGLVTMNPRSRGSFGHLIDNVNGTVLSGLTTGLIKNTTGTGLPSISVAGIDYAPAYAGSFARSLDYIAIGTSITNGTGASNGTVGPNNTTFAGSLGFKLGGAFTNGGISGGEVADILKLAVYQQPFIPSRRAPLLSLEDGTNNANQVAACGTAVACLALYSVQHQAAMAFLTIPSDNYNGGAWSSGTTYLSGDVVQSGGINYIATGGANSLTNLNKTPASNAGYWAAYVPPTYIKIPAQTSTSNSGAFVPDNTLSPVTFAGSPVLPQPLGEVSSTNGASIMLAVPTPAGNPIEFVHRISDGNGGTASVTIDGSAPGANSTISGFAAGSAVIKTFAQGNSDTYALVSYPTTATGAACVSATSSLTSNVATITCSSAFTGSVNQAVSFLGLTNLSFLNGLSLVVQSVSGTSFTVNFTHANVTSASEPSYSTATPGHALLVTVISTPTDVSVTNVSIASNVVTLNAVNTLAVGQSILFHNFATATFLNGVTLTITARTGTTITAAGSATSQLTGQWGHATYVSTADTGTVSLNWIAPSWLGTYPSPSAPATFEAPRLYVLGVPQQQLDANGTVTAQFNTQSFSDLTTLIGHGGPLVWIDVRNGNGIVPGLNPGTDFNDTLHPNDAGHRKVRDLVEAAAQARESVFKMLVTNNGNGGYGGIESASTTFNFGNGTPGDVSYSLAAKSLVLAGTFSSSLQICSGLVVNASASYSETGSECEVRLTNTAARTVTLASSGLKAGQVFYVKDSAATAGTGNITISVASSGTIDGASTVVINTNSGHVTLRWISTGVWETI